MTTIIEKELSYKLGGIFFEIQDELGRFCRERQYADILEEKLVKEQINFKREFPLEIGGRKSNFVDFIIEDKVLIDLKAKPFITREDYYQMKRYLNVAGLELGLIVNFQDKHLKPKRVLNGKNQKTGFVDSDKFVGSDRLRGFTLIELMVALSLFVIVLGISSSIFIRSLRSQRAIVSLIAVNDNSSLAVEQMAREIRTGYNLSTNIPASDQLDFTNAFGLAITYKLNSATKAIERKEGTGAFAPITGSNVRIEKLKFILNGVGGGDGLQSRVTIVSRVGSASPQLQGFFTDIQTTLSPRVLW